MREIHYLDKLIDELAKGNAMEKILRIQMGWQIPSPQLPWSTCVLFDDLLKRVDVFELRSWNDCVISIDLL